MTGEKRRSQSAADAEAGLTEVIIAKARNAECTTLELEFEGAYQRFRPRA